MADARRNLPSFSSSSAEPGISSKELQKIRTILADLDELENTRKRIEARLADADGREAPLRLELKKLQEFAGYVLDVYDYKVTETEAKPIPYKKRIRNSDVEVFSSRSISPLLDPSFRKEIAGYLKEFFKLYNRDGPSSGWLNSTLLLDQSDGQSSSDDYSTGSLCTDTVFHGRHQELEKLLSLLAPGNADYDGGNKVQVIALTGMDGVGKTTLAQMAYNNPKLSENTSFGLKGWVNMSKLFDSIGFMKATIEVFSGHSCTLTQQSVMENTLRTLIQGERVLLVMDDVRTRDSDTWDKFKAPIENFAEKGSKILITTCIREIAERSRPMVHIPLHNLSEEDGWTLLQKHAFPRRDPLSPFPENFEKIGKLIVEKSGGLPLLLKIFGSLLKSKYFDEESWEDILKNFFDKPPEIDQIPGYSYFYGKEKILECLLSSHKHLSNQAKSCIELCCIYPKEKIPRRGLKHFLIAYELVKDENEAAKCLEELESKSFLQLHGDQIYMHDYIYEFAQYLSGATHLTFLCKSAIPEQKDWDRFHDAKHATVGMPQYDGLPKVKPHADMRTLLINGSLCSPSEFNISIGKSLRVLDIDVDGSYDFPIENSRPERLRVLELRADRLALIPEWVFRLYNLRHLDLRSTIINSLSDKVSKLTKLRSLNLEDSNIEVLPASISKLINLQDLNLRGCRSLQELPGSIINLSKLQSLNLQHTGISYMPEGFGKLAQLRFLTDFLVGFTNEGAGLAELQKLTCLKDVIFIGNLSKAVSEEDAENAPLANKKYLRKLILCWGRYYNRELRCREEFKSSYEYYSPKKLEHRQKRKKVLENRNGQEDVAAADSAEKVLEHLKPHCCLEELSISEYGGRRLPSWMGSRSFTKLVLLQLCDINECTSLSPMEHLPSLVILDIYSMSSLDTLVDASIEHTTDDNSHVEAEQRLPYSKLEQLYVELCNSLDVLNLTEFASLKEVRVLNCSNIRCVKTPDSIETSSIDGCPKIEREDRHHIVEDLRHMSASSEDISVNSRFNGLQEREVVQEELHGNGDYHEAERFHSKVFQCFHSIVGLLIYTCAMCLTLCGKS